MIESIVLVVVGFMFLGFTNYLYKTVTKHNDKYRKHLRKNLGGLK